MKYLSLFMKKRKILLIVTLLLLIGQVVGTLLIPYLIAEIVDTGILLGDMSAIIHVGIKMLLASLATAVISILGSWTCAELAASFGRNMREAVFRKSQEISLGQFETIGVSSMMTRSTSDISNLQQTLGMFLQLIVPAPLIIAVCIWMTVNINGTLALIPLFCILLFVVLAAVILKKSQTLSRQIQTKMDRINQVVRESITGIRVIRAFNNGAYEQERCNETFSGYASHMIRLNKLFAVLNPAVWLVMGFSMAAIIWFGSLFSAQGTMQIGQITAVTEYTIITLSYLILAVMSCVTLPKMRSCLQRLTEVLDMEPEITDMVSDSDADDVENEKTTNEENRAAVTLTSAAQCVENQSHSMECAVPALEFCHVNFSYPGAEEPVLKDLSFRCFPGETTAIIGSTGSGKSTIANLLLRLHEINEGQILLQGMDIREMPQNELRDRISYTPQKAVLFSGTIADNLHMGNKEADEQAMNRALSIAQADTFVQSLPQKLSAPVSQNGSNFSGGQKQRLAIARCIIKESPVMVFDDSFSALDLRTDAALRRALKQQTAEATKIIIAQRIQTIADADQIIVLDEGQIAGMGQHDELMQSCEIYRSIAQSQLSPKEVSAI